MRVRVNLYGSPESLKNRGRPRRREDLDHHRLVVYGDEARAPVSNINWALEAGLKPGHERRPILQVNNTYGLFRAVSSGLGLAALPDYVAVEAPELVRILPELTGPPVEAYFVYPEELRSSNRISVFRDFLIRNV